MQDLLKRGTSRTQLSTSADSHSKSARLLESAVNMVKNGVTPDVIQFTEATSSEITDNVLTAIQAAHDTDQAFLNHICARFAAAVQALSEAADQIELSNTNRIAASAAHHECRAEEALDCARSRRCEEQLRHLWTVVKEEEFNMRRIHGEIEDEWCVLPTLDGQFELTGLLNHPFNWAALKDDVGVPYTSSYDRPNIPGYPILNLQQSIRDLRGWSVTKFDEYMVQKIRTEHAWTYYNEKIGECADFEATLEVKSPECDAAQIVMHDHACQHSTDNAAARRTAGRTWKRISDDYDRDIERINSDETDRKNEWETLTIVQCLLDHIHSSVETSIETGSPCPTIDSNPAEVTRVIDNCHIVTRGCDFDANQNVIHATPPGSMTAHLCLERCTVLPPPPLPEVEQPACTPEYVAREQGSFLAAIQTQYVSNLGMSDDYSAHQPLSDFLTTLTLGQRGWAGCAAPLVCKDCDGIEPEAPNIELTCPDSCWNTDNGVVVHTDYGFDHESGDELSYTDCGIIGDNADLEGSLVDANGMRSASAEECERWEGGREGRVTASECRHCPRVCHMHEDYLFPGQSNTETFKCRDSTNQCISVAGRCNGHAQCHDGSDEEGCDTPYGKPAYVGTEYPCEVNFLTDVHFQCASGQCVEKVGLCNGIDNCQDGSDEANCIGHLVIDAEATSGRAVTMERVSTTDSVFFGRDYSFESLGSFEHMNMIKYNNNDKQTDHDHVMMRLRTEEPVTVYIVNKADHGLSWLESEHYHLTAREGVTFGGLHSSTDSELLTRHLHHKEWGLAPGIVEGAATVGTNGNPLPALDFASQPTHFTASVVHSRSYEAGTINIPGNNGGEGSFLIFVDKAAPTSPTVMMGTTGNDGNGIVSSGGPDGAYAIQFIDLGAGAFESAGELGTVRYHVSRANQAGQKFQIYRPVSGTTYRLISETEALASTQAGSIVTQELATPLQFQAGDFIGWVHTGQGTFPFRGGGGSVRWRYGIQGVGSNIDFNGAGARIYGYEGSFTTQ